MDVSIKKSLAEELVISPNDKLLKNKVIGVVMVAMRHRDFVYKSAHELGAKLIFIDSTFPDWSTPYKTDTIYCPDPTKGPAVVAAIEQYLSHQPPEFCFDGLISFDEYSVVSCAYACKYFNLPGLSPETVSVVKHKHRFRLEAQKAGVHVPRSLVLHTETFLAHDYKHLFEHGHGLGWDEGHGVGVDENVVISPRERGETIPTTPSYFSPQQQQQQQSHHHQHQQQNASASSFHTAATTTASSSSSSFTTQRDIHLLSNTSALWKFPVVLKPCAGAGSYFVRKIESYDELYHFLERYTREAKTSGTQEYWSVGDDDYDDGDDDCVVDHVNHHHDGEGMPLLHIHGECGQGYGYNKSNDDNNNSTINNNNLHTSNNNNINNNHNTSSSTTTTTTTNYFLPHCVSPGPHARSISSFGSGGTANIHSPFMIEELMVGSEVDIDLVIDHGVIKFIALADNFPAQGPPGLFMESGGAQPSVLPQHQQEQLFSMTQQLVSHFGTALHGVFHFEAMYTNDGIASPIELNLRLGGSEVLGFVIAVYGVNLGLQAMKLACNIPIEDNLNLTPRRQCVSTNILAVESGVITKVGFDLDKTLLNPHFMAGMHRCWVGQQLKAPPLGFQYCAWMVVSGEGFEEAKKNLEEAVLGFFCEIQLYAKDDENAFIPTTTTHYLAGTEREKWSLVRQRGHDLDAFE